MKVRETGGCNVCNPALRKAVSEGRQVAFDLEGKNCAYCKSPGRHRALARVLDVYVGPLLVKLGLSGGARTIGAASGNAERFLLEPFASSMTLFSLFGEYGETHVKCDIRDMSQFPAGTFDLFEASLVLDYVPELDLAFDNIARVLGSPSAFLIFVNEKRLLSGNQPPRVKRIRNRAAGLPDYYPVDYERQQIEVGRAWLENAWRKRGYEVEQVVWHDDSITENFTWWIGHRT